MFIDWQNAYRAARRAFGLLRMPSEYGNFSPLRLGQLLAASNSRGAQGRLVSVEVFRACLAPARSSRYAAIDAGGRMAC